MSNAMEIFSVFGHAKLITALVFVMMLLVDFVDAVSKWRVAQFIRGGYWRQYVLASLLGSTPGCMGAFMNVSLQDGHGMLPMLSYSLKDSLLIKLLNYIFGVLTGGTLYFLGV